MESEPSAFAVYQKQNKNRKNHLSESSKIIKKKKRNTKIKLNKQLLKEHKNVLVKPLKAKPNIEVQSEESPDEIPILVPIDHDLKIKKHKKKNVSNHESPGPHLNGKSSKIAVQTEKKPLKSIKSLGIDRPFNPVTHSLAIFKWLVHPTTPKDFFEKYWEKEVLHVKRSDQTYFKDVFSTEILDKILREYPLHFGRNVDVVVYQNGKKEVLNEEGRALPSKLWDFYNNGCSVRILNPHTYNQNVHSLIAFLQEYFGTMVGTNVYLTPPNSQGFAPHFDDIEAFIVQLEGSKHWKLYKPKEQDVLARDSSHNFAPGDLDPPFMDVKLEAGDLLYFPRGTIHEGRTENEHSLHITISVYQHTAYIDLLEQALPEALKKASVENLEFRKGLPLNYLKHLGVVNKADNSNKRQIIIDRVKSLVSSLVNYLDVDSAADNLGRKFMHDAMPPVYSEQETHHSCKYDGDFMKNGKVFGRVEISLEIRVRLLRYYALRVVQDTDTTSKLYFCTDNAKVYHGEEEQWLEIDNSLIAGVEMLQKQYPNFVEASELPIEDETEKLALISSLWEHGLLVTDEPLPLCDSEDETAEVMEESVGNDSNTD